MEISMQINHKGGKIFCSQLAMQSGKNKANYYELLSLNSQNVSHDEIKKAYKRLALRYHPDVCTTPLTKEESTKRFIELKKAYETLSDPNSRRTYNYELSLVDAGGLWFGSGHDHEESRRKEFPREVWERQLAGLKRRSSLKKKGRNN